MELYIRQAENTDIPEISDLLLQVLRVHNAGRPDIFKHDGAKYTPDVLEQILSDKSRPVFVGISDNKLIGYAFCIIENRDGTSLQKRKVLYLDDLCVDESHRKEGVGGKLMEYVCEYAKETKADSIELNAWECNPEAVRFYRNKGFEVLSYKMEFPVNK